MYTIPVVYIVYVCIFYNNTSINIVYSMCVYIVCMYVCMYVCIYMYVYRYVCMHMYIIHYTTPVV